MDIDRAKTIVNKPNRYTEHQIKLAGVLLAGKIEELEEEKIELERIINHQEQVCKAYVKSINKR